MTPDYGYDSPQWLLGFLAEQKQEAARLAKNSRWEWPAHLPKRSKPWPRKRGLTGIKGLRMMWRV